MALWVLLVLTVVLSFGGLSASVSPEAREVAQEQARNSTRMQRWGCLAGASTVLLTVVWIWHAVEVGDWRYAALGVAPFVCSAIRMTIRREWTKDTV